MVDFVYQEPLPVSEDRTEYYLLTRQYVSWSRFGDKEFLVIQPEGLTELARTAMRSLAFFLRPAHQEQVARILGDPEASGNDRFVAETLLRNSVIAAQGVLPTCQDTGTATIIAKKGQYVFTGGGDAEALSKGVYQTYTGENLRYSQTVPLTTYKEINSDCNLPAQIDIYATDGDEYRFLFLAKGGGSANKTMLFQQTKALLNPKSLESFLIEKMNGLGTAACPPYHLAFVVGGTSADACLKVAKLASAHALDGLPDTGNEWGRAFRDLDLEDRLLKAAQRSGYGAQFGGKYFVHDVRVIRLPRHGASCPVAMAVSCSADRNLNAKIDRAGIWLEKLEENPARLLRSGGEVDEPRSGRERLREREAPRQVVEIDLNRPIKAVLAELSRYPVKTRLSLKGTLLVARDIAHAKLKERIDKGEGLPDYFKRHPVYYAGPAKTPPGMPSGSFGPTTAGRMDSYVDLFQSHGGSLVMIAKGNRSREVTEACKKHGGFYLGSIGGAAAILARESIKKVDVIDYPELGMEAIWKIEVENFPAIILVDDKGNDFFQMLERV
ncbi:MAG: fumarate hydratase [Deltaproteobacteria bacterium]|nr:fumarate hydratase [Deltaproteobacteria bacterium]